MLKITSNTGKSKPHSRDAKTTPQSGNASAIECNTASPLTDFFLWAVEQNKVYCTSKKATHQYASPWFKLVQCLKCHPELKGCTAKDAFTRLNTLVTPNWGKLFPDVSLPSLEFVTAWEQINTPAGMSLWQTIEPKLCAESRLI
jgi:hypothetical protein